MGAFVARRPPALRAAVGMVVALSGIVVVVAARTHPPGLAGAAVFAYGGFFAARHFAGVPALVVASGQQIGAAVVLVPLSAVLWAGGVRGDEPIDGHGVMNLLLLGVLGSGLAYLLFYWLIDREGPVATANVNLLVPLSGVGWSAVFLDEPLTPVTGLGVLVTIAGLALILTPQRRPEIP
jgi:drug/metabolite transporter (DMT)-like permease